MQPQQQAFPEFFEQMLAKSYCAEDVQRIFSGSSVQRKVTLRANTLKSTREEIADQLGSAGISWQEVPWYADAFIIEDAREDAVRELPAYETGSLYLQSLSSMLPPLVLEAKPGEDVLDMCAAPGGKTTQLAALGGRGLHITACEMNAPRAEKLQHNLSKQGAVNVNVLREDARRLDEFFRFDRIMLDAPCSGSGTLRAGDARMFKHFTQKLISKTMKQQAALLDRAFTLLKPGGTLVYSTCSVLPCENEEMLGNALKRASKRGSYKLAPVKLDGTEDLPLLPSQMQEALCVCPTELYEGFFVAKVRRVG